MWTESGPGTYWSGGKETRVREKRKKKQKRGHSEMRGKIRFKSATKQGEEDTLSRGDSFVTRGGKRKACVVLEGREDL